MNPCKSKDACEKLIQKGVSARAVAASSMNTDSSRSHAVFTVHLERLDIDKDLFRFAKLNLVDLAGSERQTKGNFKCDLTSRFMLGM